MSVWLLTNPSADVHRAPGHPERPERRIAVAEGIRVSAGAALLEPAIEPADEEDLTRIHDPAYLAILAEAESRGGGWLDPDTYVTSGSVSAARDAAGATLQAALAASGGEAEVAFAAVRPPGHHAARGGGRGFCLVNNIAVAVAGIRARGVAERVAIVDWDVHHGDGTQAIFDDDADVCYASTHQAPFYPGTGWAEESGRGDARGTMHNRPLAASSGDEAFVAAWQDLVGVIESFRPDVILVSAGYDAHVADPLAGLAVTEAGFETVARLVGALSERLGHGGVALTLEGGYDLDALRASAAATVRGLLAGRNASGP